MRFATLLLAGLAALGVHGIAHAEGESGAYLRGDLGWSYTDWGDGDNAFVGGGGVGYQFNDWFRSDVTVTYAGSYDIGWWYGGKMSTVSALANVYLDIPTGSALTPYVGGGAGMSWVDRGENDSAFAFDLTGGLAIDLSESFTLDFGYRYVNTNAEGSNLQQHEGLAGIRFGF
jgi:opacity protein-like surface antigen